MDLFGIKTKRKLINAQEENRNLQGKMAIMQEKNRNQWENTKLGLIDKAM